MEKKGSELKIADLVALSFVDESTQKLDLSSRMVLVDPESRDRLIKEGLVLPGGQVTPSGMAALKSIRVREGELRKGIPVSTRTKGDPKKFIRESPDPWYFVIMGKSKVVCNGEFLFVGEPENGMKVTVAPQELKVKMPDIIKQCGGKNLKEVFPHWYQAFSLGGIDIISLSDGPGQQDFVTIQAKYFDFVMHRYSGPSFWVPSLAGPVQVKARGRGGKENVVAIVSTFDVAEGLPLPQKIKGWGTGDAKM